MPWLETLCAMWSLIEKELGVIEFLDWYLPDENPAWQEDFQW